MPNNNNGGPSPSVQIAQGQSDITRHESLKSKLTPQYIDAIDSLDAFLSALGVDSLDDLEVDLDFFVGENPVLCIKNKKTNTHYEVIAVNNNATVSSITYNVEDITNSGKYDFQYDKVIYDDYGQTIAVSDEILKEMDGNIQAQININEE